jgi:predicted permease
MGASSWQIIQQTLIESLLLALAGCAVGLLLAQFGIRLLNSMMADTIPRLLHPKLNTNVLLFSIGISCVCGLLFGILPALGAIRSDVQHALKETDRGSTSASRRRSQSLLVMSEYAFTLVLLIGAGLMLHSFVQVIRTDPGFNPERTLAFDISLPETKYVDTEARRRFIDDLLVRINALPGVAHAGACGSLPLSERDQSEYLSRADEPDRQDYTAGCCFVSGDYFSAMGIRLLRGRLLTESDRREGAKRVLVIDSQIVSDLFADQNPIGKSLRLFGNPWEIVGIVAPIHQISLDANPRSRVYGPEIFPPKNVSMVLRTTLSPLSLTHAVRQTVLAADPDQPITNVRTLEQAVHHSLRARRATLILLGLFAGVAVCLACMGIYGVVSYAIGQRTSEFCIRAALGAQHHDIISLILLGSMKPTLLGMGIGLVSGLLLACLLKSQLFEVKTYDPLVFIGSVCLLGMVAVLSVYIPARRATKIDPMKSLRYE